MKDLPLKAINNILLIILCLIIIVPFIWMITASFKPTEEIFSRVSLFPKTPTLENFYNILFDSNFITWFINSVIFSLGYIIVGSFVCSLGGFVFAKYDFKFKKPLFIMVLGAQMLPIHILLIPLFIILNEINLIDSYTGLIFPLVANPIGLFFARQYMIGIEDDLMNAGRVDGASEWQIFYKLIVPISKPMYGGLGVLFGIFAWNNLIWPLVVTRSASMFPLTVGIASLVGAYSPQFGKIMAGALLAVLPMLILFFNLQRYFISGLTAGSIKQ